MTKILWDATSYYKDATPGMRYSVILKDEHGRNTNVELLTVLEHQSEVYCLVYDKMDSIPYINKYPDSPTKLSLAPFIPRAIDPFKLEAPDKQACEEIEKFLSNRELVTSDENFKDLHT